MDHEPQIQNQNPAKAMGNDPTPANGQNEVPDPTNEEPQIYALSRKGGKIHLDRRAFMGLAATVAGAAAGGCATQQEVNYKIKGKTFTGPCGMKLPPGATCTCNCISVPGSTISSCTCDEVCTCNTISTGGGGGSGSRGGHYWYPT